MPMNWTSDANAKLFLGVLNQFKTTKMKLDYGELAQFMGPDCTVRAVQQQIDKLRKQAEGTGPGPTDASNGGDSATSTPAGTPQKRKANGGARTASKKAKTPKKEVGDEANEE